MKRFLLLLILVLIPLAAAASYTDSTPTDFNAGNFTATTALNAGQVQINTIYSDKVLATSGLVGYWPFEEASWSGAAGEVKDALGLNNGTSSNAQITSYGKVKNAGVFDGTSGYIQLGNILNSTFDINKSFTMMAWVAPNASATANKLGIISKSAVGVKGPILAYRNNGNNRFYYEGFDGATGTNFYSTAIITPGNWYHVAVTRNTATNITTMYVNGASDNTAADTTQDMSSPQALTIGYSANTNGYFNGTIDEVAIWNRSLSAAEVLNLTVINYNASGVFTSRVLDLASNPENITINWSYSTPSGTSLLISTRSGQNATDFTSWSSWSSSYLTSTGSAVTSPQHRYYQYRASLATIDSTHTPLLSGVTINYSDANTYITYATSSNVNLTTSSAGSYNFNVNISDTYTITSATARYMIGSGSWSSAASMSNSSANIFNLTIPQPSDGWSNHTNQNITLEVTATTSNGTAFFTTSKNVTELIDDSAPAIDPISNYNATQGQQLNITVTAADVDIGQSLIFTTSQSDITVTNLTATSALLSWTPNATETGLQVITVFANDTFLTTSRSFSVNVTNVNDPPVLAAVSPLTGYHGQHLLVILSATDPDAGTNLTFSMVPSFFDFITTNTTDNSTPVVGTYYGISNMTVGDDEHGTRNVTFSVTDGIASSEVNTTLTVNWCGDGVCQSGYESADTCLADCNPRTQLDYVALLMPDRSCANQTMTFYAYNASNRFSCYNQGLVQQGMALCEGLDSVNVHVYSVNDSQLTDVTTLTSGTNGTLSFVPLAEGEYKFTAEKDGFGNASALVYVRDCQDYVAEQQQNYTIEQPPFQHTNQSMINHPSQEQPSPVTPQEASLFSIFLFYVLVPVLLAGLLYTSVVFYDVNKDTLPWLLETRIFLYEQRKKYDPQISAVQRALAPVYEPVAESLQALYKNTLKPLVDKLKKK